MKRAQKVKLSLFREDPDNVSVATDEEIQRLAGKLKRVPLGLTAMRIAYVTDAPGGGRMVISGNKRLRCLKAAYGEDGKVPAEWFQDITAMSEAERHEFRINANISDGSFDAEKLLAQYDIGELAELMSAEAIDELCKQAEKDDPKSGQTDADSVPSAPETPVSKRGEVYICGEHRLMCGDATSAADVTRLMGGGKADMLLTDPPYNVALGMGGSFDEARKRHRHTDGLVIANDSMPDSEFHDFLVRFYRAAADAMKPGAAFYIFHADNEGLNFRSALKESGLTLRQTLIWVKNSMTLGRQDYQWRHEPCLYGWKDGTHRWFGDRKQTTCLEFDRPTVSKQHPTMKPVRMFEYLIKQSTKSGEIVADLFGGSGTTMIAAESLGRKARLMELDPHYCDVIRRRWAEFVHGEGCDWQALTPKTK